jgi:hypothetical protein
MLFSSRAIDPELPGGQVDGEVVSIRPRPEDGRTVALAGAGGDDCGVSGRGRGCADGVRVQAMRNAALGNDCKANFVEPLLEGGVPADEHVAARILEQRAQCLRECVRTAKTVLNFSV